MIQSKIIKLIIIIIFLFYVINAKGGLYGPNKENEVMIRLPSLIDLSNNLNQKNQIESEYNTIDKSMIHSQGDKNTLIARLVENLFIVNLFPLVDKYLRNDFQIKGWGKPFLTYIKFNQPEKKYVVQYNLQDPYSFNPDSSKYKINHVFQMKEGIRHFDQFFETYIYRLYNERGLMVIRGNYVFIDSNINGIPDFVYIMYNTKDIKNYKSCLVLVASGDDKTEHTLMHSRYIDSLYLVLEYILDNYPINNTPDKTEKVEAML